MSLVATISEDLKRAMKSGETQKRDTLRFLQSALKNEAIESHQEVNALSDSQTEGVIKKLVKQRKDSIEQYRAGGRQDLVEKEEQELAFLRPYLPAALSREATEALIESVLAELGAVDGKDMGRIMGTIMKKGAGQADGALVREILMRRLT